MICMNNVEAAVKVWILIQRQCGALSLHNKWTTSYYIGFVFEHKNVPVRHSGLKLWTSILCLIIQLKQELQCLNLAISCDTVCAR